MRSSTCLYKSGKQYVLPSDHQKCELCENFYIDPWHPTIDCLHDGITYIKDKDVHDRIMQYNGLHGSECKDFVKYLDLKEYHPQPAIISTGRLASIPSISPSPEHSKQIEHFLCSLRS